MTDALAKLGFYALAESALFFGMTTTEYDEHLAANGPAPKDILAHHNYWRGLSHTGRQQIVLAMHGTQMLNRWFRGAMLLDVQRRSGWSDHVQYAYETASLAAVIARAPPVTRPFEMWRGVSGSSPTMKPGDVKRACGFLSTTLDPFYAATFLDSDNAHDGAVCCVQRVLVPEGFQSGMFLPTVSEVAGVDDDEHNQMPENEYVVTAGVFVECLSEQIVRVPDFLRAVFAPGQTAQQSTGVPHSLNVQTCRLLESLDLPAGSVAFGCDPRQEDDEELEQDEDEELDSDSDAADPSREVA